MWKEVVGIEYKTLKIREDTYERLRELSYKTRKPITQLIDDLLLLKNGEAKKIIESGMKNLNEAISKLQQWLPIIDAEVKDYSLRYRDYGEEIKITAELHVRIGNKLVREWVLNMLEEVVG